MNNQKQNQKPLTEEQKQAILDIWNKMLEERWGSKQ